MVIFPFKKKKKGIEPGPRAEEARNPATRLPTRFSMLTTKKKDVKMKRNKKLRTVRIELTTLGL